MRDKKLINSNCIIARIAALVLSLVMALAPSIQIIAATDSTAVKKANYVITNLSVANTTLETYARQSDIRALVYLKETYTLREEADAYSKSVATVGTGQTVNIVGVDADNGRNIWYKVRCSANGETFVGYVEREFLACADSRFLSFEDKYVTTTGREEVSSSTDTSDIDAFPESYRSKLYTLKKNHPDWKFVKYNTNLAWDSSVKTEGSGDRNLVYTKGTPSSYIEAKYGDGVWSYASDDIIAYYMDPRNFMDETQVFQFELLGYNSTYHTVAAVSKITDGTFMSGNIEGTSVSYAANFVSLGERYKLSPILQAARVYAEQGKNGSTLISGTYPGYEGLYNYYNINASGRTQTEIIINGLKHARDKGWTTRMAALEGGASFLSNGYTSKGQDTYYFQKWNVSNPASGLYLHQYMQDISGAYKNANSAYSAYSKSGVLKNTPFVFRIPVYDKMPDQTQKKPDANDTMTLNMDKVENLPVDQSAVLIPYINGAVIDNYGYTYSSSNSSVAIVDENGVITGVKPGNATITVKSSAGSDRCEVNVIKADIAIDDIELPKLEVTYNPDQTLADIELPENFAWLDSSTVPSVNTTIYTANYAPDDSRYNSITMSLELIVNKAKVDAAKLTIPNDLTAEVNSELRDVILPENFAWIDVAASVSNKAGNYEYIANYCIDTDNYEVTENIHIPVTVICSNHKWSEWSEPVNGKMTRSCANCDSSEELIVEEVVEEHDCVTDGHEMVDGVCSRCGYMEPTIQEHVHEYSVSASTATCTEDGEIVYICSCGDSYSEPQSKLGHKMNGIKCERCDYELKPTAAVTPVPSTVAPKPTVAPTKEVKPTPTVAPTKEVKPTPTVAPTKMPEPTKEITPTPTSVPTVVPTKEVTPTPMSVPTVVPTKEVTPTPTSVPTVVPTKALPQITKIVTPTPEPTKVIAQVTKIVEPTKEVEATPTVAPTREAEPTKAPEPTKVSEPVKVIDETKVAEVSEPVVTQMPTSPDNIANKVASKISERLELPLAVAENPADNKLMVKPEAINEEIISEKEQTTPAVTESLDELSEEDKAFEEKQEVSESAKTIIELVDTTTLNADNLGGLVGDSNNVEVRVGEGVVWDIDLAGVDINSINVDMKVTVGEAAIPDKVIKSLKSDDVVLMTLAHDGAFGFNAVLNVAIGTGHEGKYANLYYYNPDTEELELVDSVLITNEGVAAFNMKHASEYVISFSDKQQIAKTGSNIMLIAILIMILLGGIGIIAFVITRSVVSGDEKEKYFDAEDNSLS